VKSSYFIAISLLAACIASGQAFTIRDVRVFDGEKTIEHRTVIVEDGKIARVGGPSTSASGPVIDGAGKTLIPGLIDAHVHVGGDTKSSLNQSLMFGVTTELDMYTGAARLKEMKQIAREDPPDASDIRSAGSGVTAPGGHPTQMGGPELPTLSSAGEAQAFVDARIAEGSDYIKIIYDNLAGLAKPLPMLTREELEAAVRAAHKRGKLAVVHISSEQQARDAIEAGADGLAHIFTGTEASPDFGRLAARHHVFVIATLSVLCPNRINAVLANDERVTPYVRPVWMRMLATPLPWSSPCEGTMDAIAQLRAAHVPILAGTDSPIPGTAYGVSLHGELQLLVHAGLTPREALTAATSATARAFHLDDRGRIVPGLRADLVLVKGDPTENIGDTLSIERIWKRGIEVTREPVATAK
jgi:imidazolonepropionase-like amidohydrolase